MYEPATILGPGNDAPQKHASSYAAPTAQSERITILDSLRGFAILGILLMNISSFGLPGTGHDPSVYNETGINYYTWYIISLIPEGTQRALFSMLFGAGIILFLKSAQKRVAGMQPADYFFRRQLWLIVFSLFDVFILLWHGDILLDYACLGMILFAFRNLSAKKLMIASCICMLLMLVRENSDLYQEKAMIIKGERVAARDTSVTKLTPLQKEDLGAMLEFKERQLPENKLKRAEKKIRNVRGNYGQVYETNTSSYLEDIVPYLFFGLWDVLQFMFLGMAFFKLGILTGEAKTKVYWWLFAVGISVGISLSYLRNQAHIQYDFNQYEYSKHVWFDFYNLDRTFRALGIFGLLMLLYKSNTFKWLFSLLRPVGQMAFTNYLMQSFLCGLFFYGIGFGMYGKLQRHEIYYVVAVVWAFQIIFCHIWLRYFRFGPFEWAWRSLTYWKLQPLKRDVSTNH